MCLCDYDCVVLFSLVMNTLLCLYLEYEASERPKESTSWGMCMVVKIQQESKHIHAKGVDFPECLSEGLRIVVDD